MYRCQHNQATRYLTDHCTPVSDTVFRHACIRPAAIKSPFHATGSARTAVGLFLLLVRQSGTHCPKTCEIRSVLWTVTDSHWRRFYFCSTSVFSALEVCYENHHHSGACHRRGRCHEYPPCRPVLCTPLCRHQTKVQWSQVIFSGSKPRLSGPAGRPILSLQEVPQY